MDAVAVELERRATEDPWRHTVFDTVFFGGGTPTCLTPARLTTLFTRIRSSVAVACDAEITVEANPETLTDAKLATLLELGVNRLSLGVQSFTPASLRRLGRHHSVEQAVQAVYRIREAGVTNLNLDLIFAAPHQDMADWKETLACTLDLSPDHISVYGLTIEDGTPFGRLWTSGALVLPDEEAQVTMYTYAIDFLTRQGYHHYEISSFARPDAECRHNLAYWTGGDYLGLGPSAHSYVNGRRFANARRLGKYLRMIEERGNPTDQNELLSTEQKIGESIMLGLRMTSGLDVKAFTSQFGPEAYHTRKPTITTLTASGLLEPSQHRLRLTRKGLAVADTVCAELM